jgi:hypothetical protein
MEINNLNLWQSTPNNPCWVLVDNNNIWSKRLFLADLGSNVKPRYICVSNCHEEQFLNNEDNISFTSWYDIKKYTFETS